MLQSDVLFWYQSPVKPVAGPRLHIPKTHATFQIGRIVYLAIFCPNVKSSTNLEEIG